MFATGSGQAAPQNIAERADQSVISRKSPDQRIMGWRYQRIGHRRDRCCSKIDRQHGPERKHFADEFAKCQQDHHGENRALWPAMHKRIRDQPQQFRRGITRPAKHCAQLIRRKSKRLIGLRAPADTLCPTQIAI